ncbi:MAG: hypothetical protein HY532_05600 [Chloroflexi bacterium]|nr:hypothetical protein [Chloroflexota bacterium]
MGRPNWYADHPPACTCAACEAKRVAGFRKKGISVLSSLSRWFKRLGRKG